MSHVKPLIVLNVLAEKESTGCCFGGKKKPKGKLGV